MTFLLFNIQIAVFGDLFFYTIYRLRYLVTFLLFNIQTAVFCDLSFIQYTDCGIW